MSEEKIEMSNEIFENIDEQFLNDVKKSYEIVHQYEEMYFDSSIIPHRGKDLYACFFNLLYKNKGFYLKVEVRKAMYPIAFRCLKLIDCDTEFTFIKQCLTMIDVYLRDKNIFNQDQISLVMVTFEKFMGLFADHQKELMNSNAVPALTKEDRKTSMDLTKKGNALSSSLFELLGIFDLSYETHFKEIEKSIDSIVVASLWTSSMTVMNSYGTHSQTGLKLLNKVSRKSPKLLYSFMDTFFMHFLKDGKGNAVMMNEIMSIFSYLAARNAFIFQNRIDSLNTITRSINQSQIHQTVTTILSRVGRIDPITARKCQIILIQWIKDEVDINLVPHFLNGIYNIAGVYKYSLEEKDISFFQGFAQLQSDMKITELVNKIADYYHNHEIIYMKEAFLLEQRDLFGRLIQLVDERIDAKVDSKLEGITVALDQLKERTEKLEDVLEIHQQDIDRFHGKVTQLGDRVNTLEIANLLIEEQLKEVTENLEELSDRVQHQQTEMKNFIANIRKKLPLPYSYEARGTIRKRLILRFKCSKERQPDFILETAQWNKWLKVIFMAGQTVFDAATMNMMNILGDLKGLYDSLKAPGFSAQEKFETLIEQPFLTSEEEDELIKGLRENGFFQQFDYDDQNATWYRKQQSTVSAPASTTAVRSPGSASKGKSTTSTTTMTSTNAIVDPSISPYFVATKSYRAMGAKEHLSLFHSLEYKSLSPLQKSEFHRDILPVVYIGQFSSFAERLPSPLPTMDADTDFSALVFGSILYKVGGPFGIQRKRWFSLRGGKGRSSIVLTYSVDSQRTDVKGTINVVDIFRMSGLEKKGNGLWFTWFTRSGSHHGGSYRLRCECEEVYGVWKELLYRCGVQVEGFS